MTDPARAQTVDTEIAKHCAFSLPGVALTLGRQNWHCLKDTYETLASDVQVGLGWIFTTPKEKKNGLLCNVYVAAPIEAALSHMVCGYVCSTECLCWCWNVTVQQKRPKGLRVFRNCISRSPEIQHRFLCLFAA